MKHPKKFKSKKSSTLIKKKVYKPVKKSSTLKTHSEQLKNNITMFTRLNTFLHKENQTFRNNYFPHISRILSAQIFRSFVKIFLITSVVFFFCINILATNIEFQSVKIDTMLHYGDPATHEKLALLFLQNNDYIHAREEINLALTSDPSNNTLLNQLLVVRSNILKPMQITTGIEKWRRIIRDHPNYRDGYFILASLYFEQFEKEQSRKYVLKALELDPNFVPAQQLLVLLSK